MQGVERFGQEEACPQHASQADLQSAAVVLHCPYETRRPQLHQVAEARVWLRIRAGLSGWGVAGRSAKERLGWGPWC